MSTSEYKALVRSYFEELNSGRLIAMDNYFAPNYLYHGDSNVLGSVVNPQQVKRFVADLRSAFPDLRFTLDALISEGDTVVARWTMKGTHRGEFAGIPATGVKEAMTGTSIWRIAGSRFVEGWQNEDYLGLVQRLGVCATNVLRPEQPSE